MEDNIIKVDTHEQYMANMARYSLYVLYSRFIPNIKDGLKTVQRRILYTMWNDIKCTSPQSKRKSANTTGTCIAKYHPHGDASVYDAMKTLTNPWEIKVPLINYDSNSGSIQGGPQAAARYTESYLSKFAMDNIIGELNETKRIVDYQNTFDNHTEEPEYLPIKLPILLVNGLFAIAIGRRLEVPKHSLNDVIDATITLLNNPNAKIVLIPDPCQKCEIIDTDWKKISTTGYGFYTQRGIIEICTNKSGNYVLRIRSTPDLVTANSVLEKIDSLIKSNILIQIQNIEDHSLEYELDIHIILKKGADPEYVKQILYKNTSLEDVKRVNLEVIDGTEIRQMGYKAYILYFLNFRRETKFRLYNLKLQSVETRLHQIDTYIKILESGEVENIIHMIRNQNSMEEDVLVNWLMNKLKITDLQAKFILNTEIRNLSKGNLKKYKDEQTRLSETVRYYMDIITNPKLIDEEIKAELLDIKNKYGKPRQSIIISEAQASNIPEGNFKIVLTEQNYLKKMSIEEPIRIFKGDQPKSIIVGDNSKDILLFDQMGKVFRLPIHKIGFSEKNSPGIDIRMVLKKATSNIIAAIYLPIVEELAKNISNKNFLLVLTKQGLIKKIDLDDIINSTPSGIIYSRLNTNDQICSVAITDSQSDIIVYSDTKALRFNISEVPYLKRATLGNISMALKENEIVDGLSIITQYTPELVIITANGKFNKIPASALNQSSRNKSGSKVIKLAKNDVIKSIYSCDDNYIIKVTRPDEIVNIDVCDIPMGSSISSGTKLTQGLIIKTELIHK